MSLRHPDIHRLKVAYRLHSSGLLFNRYTVLIRACESCWFEIQFVFPRNFWWFLSLLWLQILSMGTNGKYFFSVWLCRFRWLLWELVALFFWLIVIDYDVKMIYKIQKNYNQMIGIYVLWGNHIDIWNITESNGKRRHRVKHDIYIFYHSESMSFISLKINLKVQNVFSGHMWIIPILSYKTVPVSFLC